MICTQTVTNEFIIIYLQLRKEFGTLTEYAILSGHPNEFENDTELRCKIIGFGCTEYGVNFAREGFITDALVKFGPWACKNPEYDNIRHKI